MTDRHSNEEFSFGSLAGAFADEEPRKKESTGPTKITRSNVTATAPAVEAVVPAVDAASAPALPAMPATPMPAMPEVQNPAQTPGFWNSAMSAGVPTAIGTGLGLLTALGYSKLRGGKGGDGQGLQAPPAVDEDLRQLKLAQEQAKLNAMYAKMNRQQELHDINLAKAQPKAPVQPAGPAVAPTGLPSATQQFTVAGQAQPSIQYGQVKTNAPTGAPSPVAPPAVQPAPVEPKPISDLERIRLEKANVELEAAKAKAEHDALVRQKKLEAMNTSSAKQAVEKQQKGGGGLSPMDKTILNNQITAAASSDVKETLAKKAAVPPATPVTAPTPVVTTPVETTPPAPTAKQASNIKEVSLPSDWPKKGMNWLTSAYGIEGAKNFIDTYNDGKPFKSHDEMKAVYDKVMVKPSFSSIPKTTRQDRGILAAEREQYKIVPGAVVPPSGGGGGGQMIRGGGVSATGLGRAGEEIHNLNPLKL